MFALCKKILCLTGAFLLCLSLLACAKEAPATTTQEPEKNTTLNEESTPPAETYTPLVEEELLSKMETWLGRGDSGNVGEKDSFATTVIKTKKDLEPYLGYMYGLKNEDIDRILADKKGKCLLVELTGITENTLYSTASILRGSGGIKIYISTAEVEETLPLHTYFLLYFPEEIYSGEEIEFLFQ